MISCANTGYVENSSATPITVLEARGYFGRAGVEFVDPRPLEAIAQTTGLIPGARLISIADAEAGILPPAFIDRSIRVIATCEYGPLASHLAAAFADLGFAHAHWIEGGTDAWVKAGLPTNR